MKYEMQLVRLENQKERLRNEEKRLRNEEESLRNEKDKQIEDTNTLMVAKMKEVMNGKKEDDQTQKILNIETFKKIVNLGQKKEISQDLLAKYCRLTKKSLNSL